MASEVTSKPRSQSDSHSFLTVLTPRELVALDIHLSDDKARRIGSLIRDFRGVIAGMIVALIAMAVLSVVSYRAVSHLGRFLIILTAALTLLLLVVAGYQLNRDIARRTQTEKLLREALRAADAASQAKTHFLATVSHEIRTPLNAIVGMTDLLLDTGLEPEQAEFARTVQSNSESLLILISDLLDSSKIEAGQVDLESIPFNPEEIIESVAEILEIRAELKGLDLITATAPGMPRLVSGDPNRFRQVLMNLVGNAIKFTEQGEIVLHAELVRRDEGGNAISVAVTDTGVGIAPEEAERIFERFVQADRSTVRRFGGSGLGLPIARSLVQLMGGELSVESKPGSGSTFRFFIPVEDTLPRGLLEVSTQPALPGVDVLLVDPSYSRNNAIAAWLEADGATTDCVRSANEAIAAFDRPDRNYIVLIVNETLPDRHAIDLVKLLQEKNGALAALVLSSLHSPISLPAKKSGIERIYKPVRRSRLLPALRRAVGLPALLEPETQTPAALALRASDIAHPRILLVEDQRDNWVLATRILTGAGYQVDLAENGVIAVEKAAGYKYDLILMDLEMPVLDGLQAATAIRTAEVKEQKGWVPIVALTAHALEGFRERAISSGMDDYVTKPIKKQQLLDICEKWIDARPVIIIADDSAESQLLITKYVRDRNYQIVTANDGQSAVEVFRRQRVSALLLDMEMPVMDGYEAARIIRKLPGGEKVPLIAMTGHEGAAAREKCMTAGCSAFISKPVRRSEIVEILDAILGPAEVKSTPLASRFDGVESDYSPSYDVATNKLEMSTLRRYAAQRRGDLLSMEARKLERFADACDLRDLKVSATELLYAASRDDNDAISLWLDRVAEAMKTSERLMGVRGTGLLDSPPEESLDRLTRIAATALQVPTTMITLVDQDRQFWKSAVGVKEPYATARGTPISHSFCYYVADRAEPLVVSDARQSPLVMHNPAISDLDIIAYAGMPMITSKGIALGSFGAIDSRPKEWTEGDLALLRDLASLAVTQLERSAGDREAGSWAAGEFFTTASPQLDLEDEIDEDIAELIPAYLESVKESAERLSALLLEKNFSAIKRVGHQLKGSGAGYGFDELTRMGRRIESAAGKKDYVAVAMLHSALATYLDQEVERRAGTAAAS
ncbi:MAG TPA: response regulator [Gemmatimonadaceae bacterium]|nr:response regulator [Gemmatimonadaceae bacterium]